MTHSSQGTPVKVFQVGYSSQGTRIEALQSRHYNKTLVELRYSSETPEKWAPKVLKNTLVDYDGHNIHRIYIKNQNKVIRVKNL